MANRIYFKTAICSMSYNKIGDVGIEHIMDCFIQGINETLVEIQ